MHTHDEVLNKNKTKKFLMTFDEETCSDSQVIDFVTQAINRITSLYGVTGAPCGYLTIRSASDGRILLVREIGDCPADKYAGRCRNSMEKGERLMVNSKHVSSYQSRDPDNQKWGGAIRTKRYLVSFSGLPELADEALCTATSLKFGWMHDSEVDAIFEASINNLGPEALKLVLD